MGSAKASSVINAAAVADNLTVASAFKMMNFGQPTARANRAQRSLPYSTAAVVKPSTVVCAKCRAKNTIRVPKKPTSSWIPPISDAASE